MALFGTSGIRGVFGKDVSSELALGIGRAAALELGGKIVLARDARDSGLVLENALAAGFLEQGGSVFRVGIAPTPTLAFASRKLGCAGAMITASHNPPEYNGIKLFDNGSELSVKKEKAIEARLAKRSPAKPGGTDSRLHGMIDGHVQLALSRIDVSMVSRKRPKVLIDAANGAGSVATPYALRMAGCQAVSLNCEVSGQFARPLEPNQENLRKTSQFTRACKADFAVAHDGDADRSVVLDEKGNLLGLDAQLAIACAYALEKKKGVVVTTVEASLAVRDAVEQAGGRLVVTPVGSRWVAEQVRKNRAVFGGEPCGEYIFPGELTVPDGIATALLFAEIFSEKGRLSQLASRVKAYPIQRAKIPCRDKESAMKKIMAEAKRAKGAKANFIDGVRLDFDEGWVLLRPSGTEPVMRITAEHRSEKGLKELFDWAQKTVKKHSR